MSLIQAAQAYIAAGQVLVVIKPGSKQPLVGEKHQIKIKTREEAIKYFSSTNNIAILLGLGDPPLNDVDLDQLCARLLAPYYLPPTGAVFGRSGAPRSHYIYFLTGKPVKYFAIYDPDYIDPAEKKVIIEFRTTNAGDEGQYTVFPPSIHPSGESIEWDHGHGTAESGLGAAATVDTEKLAAAVKRLGAACLLLAVWTEGARNDLAGGLPGMLAKAGWTEEEAVAFMTPVINAAGDTELEKRLGFISNTFEKYKSGGRVVGYEKLKKIFSVKALEQFQELLGIGINEKIEEIVNEINGAGWAQLTGGSNYSNLVHVHTLPGKIQKKIGILKIKALKDGPYGAEPVHLGKIISDKASIWIKSNKKATYKELVFEPPGSDREVLEGQLNCWQGFALEPGNGNTHEPLLEHIERHIACGDSKKFEWLMSWPGAVVQNPGRKSTTSMTFQGSPGAGKTVFASYLSCFLGIHAIAVSDSSRIVARFNSLLENKVLVILQEGFFDNKHDQALRTITSDEEIVIEKKGVDGYSTRNHVHILSFANPNTKIPVIAGDRRMAVFSVKPDVKDDRAFWRPIFKYLRNKEGPRDLLGYLLRYKVDYDMIRRPPRTAARSEHIKANLGTNDKFVNYVCCGGIGLKIFVDPGIDKTEFYRSYIEYCKEFRYTTEILDYLGLWNFIRRNYGEMFTDTRPRSSNGKRPPYAIFDRQKLRRILAGKFGVDELDVYEDTDDVINQETSF
jgi:hypothetical protein